MPFTAADGGRKVTVLTTKPANLQAVTAAEANAGHDVHDHVLKADYRVSPTGSTTHNDTPLGAKGQHTHFAQSQASGNITPFRDLDATGRPIADSEIEDTFALFKEKGQEMWLMDRLGPDPDEAWASGDEYSIYTIRPDDMQDPSDGGGFIKYVTPLAVGEFFRFQEIAATGG